MEVAETLMLADPEPCGIGEGARCCAFLVMGTDGFMCGRMIPGLPEQIRARLAEGTMNAQYDPGETPYPQCQEQRL